MDRMVRSLSSASLLAVLIQAGSTLAMTGLIWFVQVVHYPLFQRVGEARFAAYEQEHATRTGWVVAPLMLAELATAALLLREDLRPAALSANSARLGLALVLLIWVSTGLVQVPLHNQLAGGYNAVRASRLVSTNWIRTAAWTARSVLVLSWVGRLLR